MYDEGCQGWVFDVADSHDGDTMHMHVYIRHELRTDQTTGEVGKGEGWLIYKFRPLGEVFRLLVQAGRARHARWSPRMELSPNRAFHLTIYMSDDELCKFKHEWLKVSFTVDLKPSRQCLREAIAR
jgi:hypothetical protein